jgi:hypothetical protein
VTRFIPFLKSLMSNFSFSVCPPFTATSAFFARVAPKALLQN